MTKECCGPLHHLTSNFPSLSCPVLSYLTYLPRLSLSYFPYPALHFTFSVLKSPKFNLPITSFNYFTLPYLTRSVANSCTFSYVFSLALLDVYSLLKKFCIYSSFGVSEENLLFIYEDHQNTHIPNFPVSS